MIVIIPQFFRVNGGARFLTYAVYIDGTFACYSRCFCRAMRAALYLIRERESYAVRAYFGGRIEVL